MAEAKFSSANATAFAAGILRSFVVDNGQAKCKLLTWTNQEFNDWKDNGNLASLNDVIGRPVTKSGGTIKLLGQQYLDRVSTHWHTARSIDNLCVDQAGTYNWPGRGDNFMQTIYTSTGLNWNVDGGQENRDFPYMMKKLAASWKAGATYLIDKYTAGRQMREANNTFITLSENMDTFPMLLFSGQMTPLEVRRETKRVTDASNEWIEAAKRFYTMRPGGEDVDLGRGFRYLLGEERRVGGDLDYDATLISISDGNAGFCNVYTDTNITIRSAAPIHNRNVQNIETASHLWKGQMSIGNEVDQPPGGLDRGHRRHDHGERERDDRMAGETRKANAFRRNFEMLAQRCDGERIDLLIDKGEISALCWEVQELQKNYSKLLGEIETSERITNIQVPGIPAPMDVGYALSAWIKKCKSQEERMRKKEEEQREMQKQEKEDLKAILAKGAIQIKLLGKSNFLAWLSNMENILKKVPKHCMDLRIVSLLKESIANRNDEEAIKNMSQTSDITGYLELKYLSDPSLVEQTIMPIEKLKEPSNAIQAINNIEKVLNIMRSIDHAKLNYKIQARHIAIFQQKTIMENRKQQFQSAMLRIIREAERNAGNVLDNTEEMNARDLLLNMSLQLQANLQTSQVEEERKALKNYLQEELEELRYQRAQDLMAEPLKEQNKKPKEALTKRMNRVQEGERSQEEEGKRTPPEFNCPLGCGHKVKWGSLAHCENFFKTPKRQKVEKVKKAFCCIKCLKALNKVKHKTVKDCTAPSCKKCGGHHHTMVCPKETSEQKLYKTSEDDDGDDEDDKEQDGYEEGDDPFDEDLSFRFANYGNEQEGSEPEEDPDNYEEDDLESTEHLESSLETLKMNKIRMLKSNLPRTPIADKQSNELKNMSQYIPMNADHGSDKKDTIKGDNKSSSIKKKKLDVWTKDQVLGSNFELKDGRFKEEQIRTQERPWSFQDNLKWKMIKEIAEEEERLEERATKDNSDIGKDLVENFKNFKVAAGSRMKEDQTKLAEPPPKTKKDSYKPKILPDKFLSPNQHPDYINVGPQYSNGELYKMMKEAAGDLYDKYSGVKSMSGRICVEVEKVRAETGGVDYIKESNGDINVYTYCLFDTGSDGGALTKEFDENHKLNSLRSKVINLKTVSGTETNRFQRKKLTTYENMGEQAVPCNFDCIVVPEIGHENNQERWYIHEICRRFKLTPKQTSYFLKQASKEKIKIHVLLGLRGAQNMMKNINVEQLSPSPAIKLHHPWELPNVGFYQSTMSNDIIIAGSMGINRELFDQRYPTFRVHKTELEELELQFGDKKRLWYKMRLQEDPDWHIPDHKYRSIERQDENQNEEEPMETEGEQLRLQTLKLKEDGNEDIDLKEVDPWMDGCMTFNATRGNIQEEISLEEVDTYMRHLNEKEREGLTPIEHRDFYSIKLNEDPKEKDNRMEEECEGEEWSHLTSQECGDLKKWIEAENTYQGRISCQKCIQRNCRDCTELNTKYSEVEKQEFLNTWNNTFIIDDPLGQGKKVMSRYTFQNDPHQTFKPENSNMKEALARTKRTINTLKKKNKLKEFQDKIQEKIDIGTLIEVGEKELKGILAGTHHFTYLSVVTSETSETTSTRLINNTLSSVPGAGTTFSQENKKSKSEIGDSWNSLLEFMLEATGISADISKCYLRVGCDYLASCLRLCIWFRKPETMEEMVIYRRASLDFGDSQAALVVRIIQEKYLARMVEYEASRHICLKGSYADNYSGSMPEKWMYQLIENDLITAHKAIGLPLKNVWTDVNTDAEVLTKIGKDDQEDPCYGFLGIQWHLLDDTITPNSYLSLGKKERGAATDVKLEEIPAEMFSDSSFLRGITRRVLSRLTAQVYTRTGRCLGPMVSTIKILLSRACEISPGTTDIDKSLLPLDEEFTRLCGKILQSMSKYKNILPFPRSLIPENNKLSAIVSFADGGIPAYGMTAYILSERRKEDEKTTKFLEKNTDKIENTLDEITTTLEEVNNPNVPRTVGMNMNATATETQPDTPEGRVTKSRTNEMQPTDSAGENLTRRIACSKSKCSKRTVPANESSARALQADVTKALCSIISMKKEYHLQQIPIIMLGDSLCVAAMFSPHITLKNTLLRTAISSTKTRAREILDNLPNAVIFFSYLPGTENSSDLVSKLFMNPINAINSSFYREGPEMLKKKSTMKGLVFMRISKEEETFIPLPEKFIKRSTQKIEDIDKPGKDYGNTEEEKLTKDTNVKCLSCTTEEDCGLFITRQQKRAEEQANAKETHTVEEQNDKVLEGHKRKHVGVSCEGPGLVCKKKRREEPIEGDLILNTDKVIASKVVTKKARLKEREAMVEMGQQQKHLRKSLIKVDHEYIFQQRIFTESFYKRLLHSKFSIRGTLNVTRHALAFLVKIKKLKQQKENKMWKKSLMEEAWRQLLLCSQQFCPIQKIPKSYSIQELQGVKIAKFRLKEDNHLLGANFLPILNVKSMLAGKLLNESHLNPAMRFLPIHRTISGSIAEVEKGGLGVLIPGAKQYLQDLSVHCKGCNEQRDWYYTPELGNAYTMLGGRKLFQHISMDPLGYVYIKPWVSARKAVKKYPVVMKDVNYGGVYITLAEDLSTSQMLLALLRLEQQFGPIDMISRDGGSDLLEGNLNPRILNKDHERLLGAIKDVAHLPDSQYRNYCERSINLIKRFMRQIVGKVKEETLPTLLFSEWLFVLEKCARTCNEIPYCQDPENLYVCPQDLMNPSESMTGLEDTDSHLVSINEMVKRVKAYEQLLMKVRDEQIYGDLKRLSSKKNKRARGPEISPEKGDIIMFRPKGKFNATVYGKVTDVGDQTIEFCTRDKKTMRRPACLVTPLIFAGEHRKGENV